MDRGRALMLFNALEDGLRESGSLTVQGRKSCCFDNECFCHISVESSQCEMGDILRSRIGQWKTNFDIEEEDVKVKWEWNGKGSVDIMVRLDVDFVGITDESGISYRAMDAANPALIQSSKETYDTEVIAMDPNLDRQWLEKRFDKVDGRLDKVDERFDKLTESVDERFDKFADNIDKRLDKSDDRFDRFVDKVDERFDKVDERFDKVDERFDKVDERFDKVDERFDKVNERFDELTDGVDERFDKAAKSVDKRFDKSDEKFDKLVDKIDEKFDKFADKSDEKFDKFADKINDTLMEMQTQISKIEGYLMGRKSERKWKVSKTMVLITAASVAVSIYLAFFHSS
ncbi:hypothetical protein [Thioalkalivibrio sp. HK1]|uniref:hypothetical protein n=1 Tax=Thioalkalivibrio sp. HK1 TaxID=1469245 RepID=UPI0004B6E313|nr:hypothetical protein [Thioalkalivibrio sp. HK1]